MTEIIAYILLALIGTGFILLFIRDSRIRFISIFAMIIVLNLKSEHASYSLLDYFAAGLFTGSFFYIILKKKFIENTTFTPSPLFIFYSLFLIWAACIGIIGMTSGVIALEQWYREILLFICPLFLLPIFYAEIIKEHNNLDRVLSWCLFFLWIIVFCATVLKIKSNVAQAIYAYQIGSARFDNINAGFMIFIFVSLGMITVGKRRWLLLIGLSISAVGLFLTFGRTSWVATFVFLPIVVLLGKRSEIKRGIRFGFFVIATILPLFIAAYLYIPIVHISTLIAINKLFTSSQLGTDISMYNRYVEWRYALKEILSSPISGHGFGATFWDYNWISKFSYETGYIHNAFLTVLLRGGVVGLILVFVPCVGFFIKGIRYVKSKFLTDKERAYLRAANATILFTFLVGYTGSLFLQRDMVIYIALFWCFIMEIEHKIAAREKVFLNSGVVVSNLVESKGNIIC